MSKVSRAGTSVMSCKAGLFSLAIASNAIAGVVVVTPPVDLAPAVLPTATTLNSGEIDVNSDGQNDFFFVFSQPQQAGTGTDWDAQLGFHQAFGSFLGVTPLDPAQPDVARLAAGTLIGPTPPAGSAYTPNFPAFPTFDTFGNIAHQRGNGTGFGQYLAPNGHGFVGFRLDTAGGPLFGYIEINATRSPGAGQTGIDFISMAYESTPNTGIIAGAVPEPTSLGAIVVGGITLLARRRAVVR